MFVFNMQMFIDVKLFAIISVKKSFKNDCPASIEPGIEKPNLEIFLSYIYIYL